MRDARAETAPRAAASHAQEHAVPRCGAPDASARRLTSYDDVRADDTRWVVAVARDDRSGEWIPTPLPEMPHHHATRVVWTNAADFPELASARGERMRFTFRVLSREVTRATATRWNAEIAARVDSLCSESAEASRPEGARLASIGVDTSRCAQLEAAVTRAAADAARCSADSECFIREVPVCSIDGLGCYWAAVSRARPAAPLDDALRHLQASACPSVDCDCPVAPTSARCVNGRCQP